MKLLENISSGYKRIATGIAIIGFLSMLYLALIPGASFAYIYGPNGGVISGAFVFIKEWPQYNTTTPLDGSYSIPGVPYGDYTLVAAGNDSFAPNISSINVSESTVSKDITLSPAINYYLPFLYQSDVYQAGAIVVNNGTSNASVESKFYYTNSTLAGNDFNKIPSNELLNKEVFDITGKMNLINGPEVIKSDSPIQVGGYIRTIASDVYSLAPSLTEADASTNLNIPFLYSSTVYNAGVQIFNIGNEAANTTIKLYYTNGTQAYSNTYDIKPKEMKGNSLAAIFGSTTFTGSAQVSSNRSIVAQGFIRTIASNTYSIAPAIGKAETNLTIPFLYSSTVYNAGVQILNNGTETANTTIKLYYTNGTQAYSNTYDIQPKELKGNPLATIFGTSTFTGYAKISSNKSIVAQAFIRTIASNAYSIAPQVRIPESNIDIHIPFLRSNGSYNSGVQVVNINDVNTTITVRLYRANGSLAKESISEIEPGILKGHPLATLLPGEDFTGYSIISADHPVVAQGFIRTVASNIYGVAPPVER